VSNSATIASRRQYRKRSSTLRLSPVGQQFRIQTGVVGPGQRMGTDGHGSQRMRITLATLAPDRCHYAGGMPIATPEVYAEMLDRAKAGQFAYPAINVTSSQSIIAALRGFAEAESDGIIQFSWGGAEFASGQAVKDMVTGAVALAEFANVVAEKYPVNVALHTDHCPMQKLDGFMRPLVDISIERVKAGKLPLFQSHMWDGSAIPLDENLDIAEEMLDKCHQANIIMELEIGVVGGEEDGIEAKHDAKLFSTPEDGLATAEKLGLGERGRYMVAATFGNVHGVYKPGNVVLTPSILKDIQDAVGAKYGVDKPFDLVFHGGSGSLLEEIREALDYGVVKMNVDTDTQYAFSRPCGRLDVQELRRRPEGRRRGRQQEAVRPARLGQGRRGGHGRPRRACLRGPALRRHQDELITDSRRRGSPWRAAPSPVSGAVHVPLSHNDHEGPEAIHGAARSRECLIIHAKWDMPYAVIVGVEG
jgi:fructose-bisphosphate aldolase class II